jgi:hypothetical protein
VVKIIRLVPTSATPLQVYEVLLIAEGKTPGEAKAEYAEKTRINALADTLKGKPIDEWPPFDTLWDGGPPGVFLCSCCVALTLFGTDQGFSVAPSVRCVRSQAKAMFVRP